MKQKILKALHFGGFTLARLREDNCPQVAAGLTYTTLLALVPLVTIVLTFVTAFPGFSGLSTQLKIFLLSNVVPEYAGKIITVYMTQFSENAARLTTVGILFLVVTALLLMLTIENAFNAIWRVTQPRPMLQRLLMYWAVLTVGPLLIGASLSLTSWLVTLSMGVSKQIPAIGVMLLKILPLALTTLACGMLFLAVPNRYVPRLHALAGGFIAALAFELMKRGFAFYIANFPTYEMIYGAFAGIVIFLLWVYFSWLVLLLGAEITASLSNWRSGAGARPRAPGHEFYDALQILGVLFSSLKTGEVVNLPRLRKELQLGLEDLDKLLQRLSAAGWIRKVVGEGWVLVRDPDEIRVGDVYRLLVFRPEAMGKAAKPDEPLDALIESMASKPSHEMDVTLRQLFTESKPSNVASIKSV